MPNIAMKDYQDLVTERIEYITELYEHGIPKDVTDWLVKEYVPEYLLEMDELPMPRKWVDPFILDCIDHGNFDYYKNKDENDIDFCERMHNAGAFKIFDEQRYIILSNPVSAMN